MVQTTGPISALVELPDGRVVLRHQDHVQKNHNQDPTISNLEILVPGVLPNCTTDTMQPSVPAELVVSSPDTQEAKLSCPVRNHRLPECFKGYEL